MDFRDSPEEAVFRADLRAWLAVNLPADWSDRQPNVGRYDVAFAREWTAMLHAGGWTGLSWPVKYGGRGLPLTYQGIYLEECARADAPDHIGPIGLAMAGPTILTVGTPAQKQRHLPKILTGEEIFCQGFSEPESGSDLASLRTRAERDGEDFVVNGQKIWSSYAEIADWCILLTRSEPTSSRHSGLTYLLLDMTSPGVEVRPLRQMTGDPEFNEIFFTDVRVPAANVLGAVGGGWQVAMTTLLHERGTLGFALTVILEKLLNRLIATARTVQLDGRCPAADPLMRDRIAGLWIDLQGLRYTNYRALSALLRTGAPGPEGSAAKLHWSEANQRLTSLAIEMMGAGGLLDGTDAWWGGFWSYAQLRSRGNTIEAGTSEILRTIIAERVLDLPRSR